MSEMPPGTAARHPLPSALLHDLRTPLNHIIGYSEMLIEQAQEEGQGSFVPDLQKAHAAARQLLAIITNNFSSAGEPHLVSASAAPIEEPAPEPWSPEELAEGGQGRLLVVDDEQANRDVLSRRLERQGYSVATVAGGREALETLRAQAFDLVLLDIMMPWMDGYEVLRQLKADEALRHLPVVMISALTELDSVVRCLELGAEDYLPKPFNPTLLKARVGACLEKKRAHDRETQLFAKLQGSYERLQLLEKLRDDLTNMIIHDLRTPLNSMLLGLQALEMVGGLDEDQREILELTRGGGVTLAAMINDVLDISKMESGAMELQRQELTATGLVEAALKQVAAAAQEKQLRLMQQVAPGLPHFFADEAKLLRTLVNLLGNAVKFTPSAGTVTVAAQLDAPGSALLFSVSDTGEGIPPEAFGLIFEKFGQVSSRQRAGLPSTGLGLTFCKLAVEAHGGQIAVRSAPGEGSTFSFTLPVGPPAEALLAEPRISRGASAV
jgi:two-component system sensor histidine kinase/response regulator